jgi:ankyrin repeat protein
VACDQACPAPLLVSEVLSRFQKGVKEAEASGMLPLHLACNQTSPCAQTVALLLKSAAGKTAAATACAHAWLPLHVACAQPDVSPAVLRELIAAYPNAAKEQVDFDGSLPLHLVCSRKQPSAAGLAVLRAAFPLGARARDGKGRLPVHLACRHSPGVESLEVLLRAYADPEACAGLDSAAAAEAAAEKAAASSAADGGSGKPKQLSKQQREDEAVAQLAAAHRRAEEEASRPRAPPPECPCGGASSRDGDDPTNVRGRHRMPLHQVRLA